MKTHPFSFATLADTRVLAFARTWSPATESTATMDEIRACVLDLGAELTVVCDEGIWLFRPEDDGCTFGAYSDRLAGDVATAATLYAARSHGTAVFVLAGGSVVRVGDVDGSLLDGLDAAIDLVERRERISASTAANANVVKASDLYSSRSSRTTFFPRSQS
jgi:hypothetical protein